MEQRLKNAFGTPPPGFEAAMRRAINEAGQPTERNKALSARKVLVAAALLALLVSTAYAAMKGLGILDMLAAQLGAIPQAGHIVQDRIAQQGGQLPHTTVTVEQAIADGRMIYFTLRISPNDPAATLLLDEYEMPTELMPTREDMTYAEQAAQSGQVLVRAMLEGLSVNGDEQIEFQQIGSAREENDLIHAFYAEADAPVDEGFSVRMRLGESDIFSGAPIERGTLTAEITPGADAVSYRWDDPIALGDLGIELMHVRVTDTPVMRFGEIGYRVLPTEDEYMLSIAHGVRLAFLDGNGQPIESLGGSTEETADGHYTDLSMLAPQTSPDAVSIGIYSRDTDMIALSFNINDAQKEYAQ